MNRRGFLKLLSSIAAAVVVVPAALIASLNKPKPLSSDYLTCSDGADWNFDRRSPCSAHNGDFTVDFWRRFPPLSDKQIIDTLATKPDQKIFTINTEDTWHHIAIVRNSDKFKIYKHKYPREDAHG